MPVPSEGPRARSGEHAGPVLGLSDEELALCAKSCVLLNRQIGIGSALTYLFGILSEHFPLTRIFCGFRRYKTSIFTPLADTLSDTHNRVRTLATTNFTQDQINLLMGSDSLRPYTINNASMLKNAQTSLREEDLASYLRIPLFTVGEATFQLIFCSNIANTFSQKLVDKLLELVTPLGESLREDFMNNGDLRPAERIGNPGGSASNRLRAMKGMHDLYTQMAQAASTDCTVLILGETGTGKELVASAVQELSLRSSRPFVKVNCGAINEQLVDSELFGHERGAFTGAYGAHTGYFEAANGGTIFLDEIGDLPLSLQARLLRVLDQREIRKVGGTHAVPLDIRVIAATHRNLMEMVRQGKFREDLWYRLNVCVLHIPPLRAHRSDIPALARLFLIEKSKIIGVNFPSLTPEQLEKLCQHNWPGNVRELEHLMERVLVRLKGGQFKLDDILDSELSHIHRLDRTLTVPPPAQGCGEHFVCPFAGSAPSPRPQENADEQWNGPVALRNLLRSTPWPSLKDLTESYIDDALRHTGGRIGGDDGAAALLNVHPNTLRVRRQKKKQTDGA
ncbi:sigma-54 interaction domain-containing protein [Mailhella massiliensis]|uniref:sigma-54 interaction domain-containing protein n=1 Tax=Mailhella massiliensis TaxID=1903261 RepID=UPI0023536014|nr:sigma-54 dependent transcriptional regulator [Mailhella massiliensis]